MGLPYDDIFLSIQLVIYQNLLAPFLVYSSPMFPLFLRLPEGMVLDPKLTTGQTKIRTVCLSVISEFCRRL